MIPFVGLKLGKHTFEFEVSDAFFESFEYSIVQAGTVKVELILDKKETMMIGEFSVNGTVNGLCDRCNDPVEVEVSGDYRLIFKFDDQPSDDETLIIVYPEEFELDLKAYLLELITVSLPTRLIHKEGECNEEMLELLDEYMSYTDEEDDEDNGDTDPRWDALKKLK